MSEILIDNKEDFYAEVAGGKAVVLFTAPAWCVPCQRFEPHWRAASEKSPLTFIKIDMGETQDVLVNHWATQEFGIRGVPTVMRFYDDTAHAVVKSRALIPFLNELSQHE